MALFGRQVILSIGPDGGVGREFRGFRVRFKVSMNRSSTPNSAVIEAFNLNPTSIALAQDPTSVVELRVGYDVPLLIFRGNPVKDGVRLDRQRTDAVLRIEAQDGGRAYASSRISVSYSTSTTAQEVFDAVAEQMGLPQGTIRVPTDATFPRGVNLNGPARDVLDRLARSLACEWFVRDGALQFVGAGEDTGETAVSPFFTYCCEYIINVLLRYKASFGLCSFKESFTKPAS
ncbi:MAG: hypothetical protein ACEQSX_12840 [Baekduiaceae bacterium]